MATLTSSLIVRLVDQVSRPARGVANSIMGIQKAGMDANRVPFGQRLGQAIKRNDAQLAKARGGLIDAAAGFYALKTAIAAPVREAMQFESAMADVKKVVDFPTPEAFKVFTNDLISLSKEVPISVNGLASIAAAAGQAGIAGDDLNRFTEAAAKVGVAFDISADQAGTAMAKMMTGLGMNIDEVLLLSDSMNHLSNSQASSASEILDVVRRVGAQGKQFGFASTEVAAFASAMIAAGADSNVAATSFRNMGLRLNLGASATKKQRAALKSLGLDAAQVAKSMQKDAVGTTIDVLERLGKMPAETRAALSSEIFGNEARALGPLLTNLDLVRDSLALVDDASKFAGSSFKEFEVRAGTFENAAQIFSNRLSAMKVVIGAALIPAINSLMDSITPVIERITQFAQANPELVSNVMAAAASIVALKVAIAGLKFVGLLGRGGALAMLSLGLKTVGRASTGLWRAAAANVAYTSSLSAMAGRGKLSSLQKVGAAVRGMAFAVPGVAALSGVFGWLAAAATTVGAAIAAISAPVWAGIAVAVGSVAAAGFWLWKKWDQVSSVVSGVARRLKEELQPAFDAIKPVLEAISPVTDAVGASFRAMQGAADAVLSWFKTSWADFESWISGFFQKEVLTEEDKAAFEQSGYDMADAMVNSIKSEISGLVDWFTGLPRKIIDAVGSINLGNIIDWPEPPEWWKSLFGGDDDAVSLPTPSEQRHSALPPEKAGAAAVLERVSVSGLPDPAKMQELKGHAENLRREIAAIQADMNALVESPMKATVSAPMEQQMRGLKGELQEVQAELDKGEQDTKDVTAALAVLSDAEASPTVNSQSIQEALTKVRALSRELNSLKSGSTGGVSVPIAGKRRAGGSVEAGKTYLVGEDGPELRTFDKGGFIHNARRTINLLRGATSGSKGAVDVSGLSRIAERGAAAISGTSIEIPTSKSAGNGGGVTLQVNTPLIGTVTILDGQNPLDVVDQIGEALEAKLSRMMRGLHSDGIA